MRVTVDTGVCVGAGMCALTVPAVFDQSEEEGLVVVLRSEVPAGLEQAVRRALTLCPSGALAAV